VDINLSGGFYGTGLLAGRQILRMNAENIDILGGRVSAQQLALNARRDINIFGAEIEGRQSLLAAAGRDINIHSTIAASTGFSADEIARFQVAQISDLGSLRAGARTSTLDRVALLRTTADDATLQLYAGRDLNANGALVSASGNAALRADNDLRLGTLTLRSESSGRGENGSYKNITTEEIGSTIVAKGEASLSAGRDISLRQSKINSSEDVVFNADRNIDIQEGRKSSINDSSFSYSKKRFMSSYSLNTAERNYNDIAIGAELSGKNVYLQASQDIDLRALQVSASENLYAIAKDGTLEIRAAENYAEQYSFHEEKRKKYTFNPLYLAAPSVGVSIMATLTPNRYLNYQNSSAKELTLNPSSFEVGKDLQLSADEGIISSASAYRVGGDMLFQTQNGDIHLGTQSEFSNKHHESKSTAREMTISTVAMFGGPIFIGNDLVMNLVSANGTGEAAKRRGTVEAQRGNVLIAGDDIEIKANAGEIDIIGGQIIAANKNKDLNDQAVRIIAAGDVRLDAAQTREWSYDHATKYEQGFFYNGGLSASLGNRVTDTIDDLRMLTHQGSVIQADIGDIEIRSGGDYLQRGSGVIAALGDIQIVGDKVDILQANDFTDGTLIYKQQTTSLNISISNPVLDTAWAIYIAAENAKKAERANDMVKAALTAGVGAYTIFDGIKNGGFAWDSLSANAGVGQQTFEQRTDFAAVRGISSELKAGSDITVEALQGDFNLVGSTIRANEDVHLLAAEDLSLLSFGQLRGNQTSFKSYGWEVGATVTASLSSGSYGYGVYFQSNVGKGEAEGFDVTHLHSFVDAGSVARLSSGVDMTLRGAQVAAPRVEVGVGGDLIIQTVQNESEQRQEEKSASARVEVLYGSGSYSGGGGGSVSYLEAEKKLRTTILGSGLYAGTEGFDVRVGRDTTLVAGILRSEAGANNRLETENLSWVNLENEKSLDAYGVSWSFSTGYTEGQKPPSITQTTLNLLSSIPSYTRYTDGEKNTSASAISAGEVVIRNTANQKQDIATLSRDPDRAINILEDDYDFEQVKLAFEIDRQLSASVRQLIKVKAAQVAAKEKALQAELAKPIGERDTVLIATLEKEIAEGKKWTSGGVYNIAIQSVLFALGGQQWDQSFEEILQRGVVSAVHQLVSKKIGDWKLASQNNNPQRPAWMTEALFGALHVIHSAGAGYAVGGELDDATRGAVGVATGLVLSWVSDLLQPPKPTDRALEQQRKKELLESILSGLAIAFDEGNNTGASLGGQVLENNWLSHAQHEQYYRELRGAETYVDVLKVLAKWEVLSTQQTYATSLGIVDGMVQRGVQDVGAFYEALKNHKQTYDSLIELFSSVEGIKLAGQALANDYLTKLKTIKYALEHGQNPDEAFVMGQDLGAILFDVGSLVLGGTISAKAGSILAKAGLTYAPRITNAIIKSAAYVNRTFGALKSQSLRILKNGVEIGVARFDEATQRFIHTFKEGFGLSDELQYATSDGLSFSQRELDDLNVNYHKNNGGGGGYGGVLTQVGDNTWESAGGLLYKGLDRAGRNRVEHVLRHAEADPSRINHTVFNVDRDKVLELVDEAWNMRGSPLVSDAAVYIIPMSRTVGTAGENAVKIVVIRGTNQIVTSYPVLVP
jgi:hypothetical protein